MTFQWNAPSDDGGAVLIGYRVYEAVGSGLFTNVISAPA